MYRDDDDDDDDDDRPCQWLSVWVWMWMWHCPTSSRDQGNFGHAVAVEDDSVDVVGDTDNANEAGAAAVVAAEPAPREPREDVDNDLDMVYRPLCIYLALCTLFGSPRFVVRKKSSQIVSLRRE